MEQVQFNQLVAKAMAGDKKALDEVITQSYQPLYHYARRILKDSDLAADALHEALEEIIENIGDLRHSEAFVVWSRRILYHHCIKPTDESEEVPLLQGDDGETLLDRLADSDPVSLPEEVVQNKDLHRVLQEMLDTLPQEQRAALMLQAYGEMSIAEIAEIQNKSENTVKSRLRLGRAAMEKKIKEYEAQTGIRLHSVAIGPLLYFLFHVTQAQDYAEAAALAPSIPATISATAGASATAASATGMSAVMGKIVAAVLAVAVVGGGVAVALQSREEPSGPSLSNPATDENTSQTDPSAPTSVTEDPNHTHSFLCWAFDKDCHWLYCTGDENIQPMAHTYVDGECSVCRMQQPLPEGNPLLTFDCTTLGGHWLNAADTQEDTISEFYVSDNGTLFLQGKNYYPIGNLYAPTDPLNPLPEEERGFVIYYRETPYDPEVGVTEEEMYSAPVILDGSRNGKFITLSIEFVDEEGRYFNSVFYRESDYFGYEKVALTMENYREYLTISIGELACSYDAFVGFRAWSDIDFTLREDLGGVCWYDLWIMVKTEKHIVTSNVKTQVSECNDMCIEEGKMSIPVTFWGSEYHQEQTILMKDTIPINDIIKWFGHIPVEAELQSITGYVFVPKSN